MRNHLMLALTAAIGTLIGTNAGAQQREADLDVTAADGAKLRATYYSPGRPGPAVLLLHQCNMNRRSWTALGRALADAGLHALAIDYRGYGDSPRATGRFDLARDIDSALATLLRQPGVEHDRLAAGGASCGVNNAVQLARRSGQVRALLLLSGPTTPAGLEYLQAHPTIAIFAAASSREQFAVTSLTAMVGASKNSATTMRVIDRPGHGVPLFDGDPTLLPAIVAWLERTLQ